MALPNISAEVDSAATMCTASFSSLATGVSSSCDLMGTIGSLTEKLTKSIVDEVTGVITEVKVAASEVVSDIKGYLAECFSGSGSVLNSIQGYIAQGKSMAAEIAAKARNISTAVMAQLQSLMDTANAFMTSAMTAIRGAISNVMSAIADVQSKLADVVSGIKMGMCSAMSSVLAGSPNAAFANITAGTTDKALQAVASVKGVYNTGANSMLAVTGSVVESSGATSAVKGLTSAASGMSNIVPNFTASAATVGNSLTSMRSILNGIAA